MHARYRIEVHFGRGWEWYGSDEQELRACRVAKGIAGTGFPCRVLDTHDSDRIIYSR